MRFNHFNEYYQHIAQQIAHQSAIAEVRKLRQISIGKLAGVVYTDSALVLKNGGMFNFKEEVSITEAALSFVTYSYEYSHTGYFFRYDMTERGYQPFTHEICHLHANSNNPVTSPNR